MRIDSDRASDTERTSSAAALAAQTSLGQPAVLSFAAALHKHRQTTARRSKDYAGSTDALFRRWARATRVAPQGAEGRALFQDKEATGMATPLSLLSVEA